MASPEPGPEATAQTAPATLWERFREPFSAQAAVLEEAAMAVLSGDLQPELAGRALREAHKLAGSLGTFGNPRGSEIARGIESWFGPDAPRDQEATLRLSDAVRALRRCLDAGPAVGRVNGPPASEGDEPFLLLVDDDPVLAEGLRGAASMRGLGLEVVPGAGAARELVVTRRPDAVLVAATGTGMGDVFELMGDLKASVPPIPVVVLTEADTFTVPGGGCPVGRSGLPREADHARRGTSCRQRGHRRCPGR